MAPGDKRRWVFHGRTDVGKARMLNEDAFGYDPEKRLIVVADGMGGHRGGSVASRVAVEGLLAAFDPGGDPDHALCDALIAANRAVLDTGATNEELSGMGCTLVAAHLAPDAVTVCHLGDSRAYLGLPEGHIERLTRDHSYVETLVTEMGLTTGEARMHPMRHIVTRAVGTSEHPHPESGRFDFPPDGRLLLCTDGLWSMLEDRELEQLLFSADEPERVTEGMVRDANIEGGEDNITAAVAWLA